MKRLPLLTIALLFGIAFVTTTTHAQTKLTWKLKAGETLHYVTTDKMKIMTNSEGGKSNVELNIIMDITWKVNRVNEDGSFDITQTIDRMRYEIDQMKMPGHSKTKLKWDSVMPGPFKMETKRDPVFKKEEKSRFAAMTNYLAAMFTKTMMPMIGTKIGMTLAANGTPRGIKTPEIITKSIAGNPVMKSIGEMFSADGMKKMIGLQGGIFPEKPIKAGESWKRGIKIEMPFGTVNNKYTYTYKGKNEKGFEEISPQVEIDITPKEKAQTQKEMKVKESQGTMLFDNKKGRIHSSHLKFVIEEKTKTEGKTSNQKITTTTTFNLVAPKTKEKEETESKSK